MTEKENLFLIPKQWDRKEEYVQIIHQTKEMRIERIISCGHTSPVDFWYDQDETEWVTVIQGEGEIIFSDGNIIRLKSGESVLIPAKVKHRVSFTSQTPECIWLAVFMPTEE